MSVSEMFYSKDYWSWADNTSDEEIKERLELVSKMAEAATEFKSGAKRVPIEERYDLIPPIAIRRLSLIYAEGVNKYGKGNWKKGIPYSDIVNHLQRHLYNYIDGCRKEDHLAKIMWACATLMYYDEHMQELNDL